MSLLIFRVRRNFSCSFVVLIGTHRSQKNWHPVAACTEQQQGNTVSQKSRKHCKAITFSGIGVDVIQLMEEKHCCSEDGSGGADQD